MDDEQKKHFKVFLVIMLLAFIFMGYIGYTEHQLFTKFEAEGCAAFVKRCVDCQKMISEQWDAFFINDSPLAVQNPERFAGNFNTTGAQP